MLLNRTEQLINELDTFEALQLSSNESKVYIERNIDLKAILVYVEGISEVVSLFRKHGFSIDIDTIMNYPVELFRNLYTNWEIDKSIIKQKNDFFRRVHWNDIESNITSILQKQWEEHVEFHKPNINKETLDVFEKIPDFSNVVSNLREKLESLEEYKKILPSSDSDFKLVISSSLSMKDLIEQLESKNIPDSVSNFLKKAGTYEGIDLSEITPEILDWLKENDLIHLCQVRFRK